MTDPLPATMRAAALRRYGPPDEIEQMTLPLPEVGPDQVLIRVEAAGVGSWDATEREGHYDGVFGIDATFPYILGWEGAGVIAAVGERVRRFSVGDRVYAVSRPVPDGGFYAQYAVVGEEHVSLIPDRVTIEQAAVMAWDSLTAISGLDTLDLKPGQTLMIFGASGGIGHMAVQFAKRLGLRVFAVASGDDGVALAKTLGADVAIDGRRDDIAAAARAFAPDGLDAALLTAGGPTADRALASLRAGGRATFPSGTTPEPIAPDGVNLDDYNGDRGAAAIARLNELIETGPFEVHVAGAFPLEQAADAHRRLASHFVGKLVLSPV